MKITREIVEYAAELSRIELDGDAAEKMREELGAIIEYMDILNKLDTEGVEPLSHIFAFSNVTRPDEVAPSCDRDAILLNAPERTDETVIVPKTIE